jgi:hypothetical protein
LQALHRVRERLVSQRAGIINQIRAFRLERGVAVRQGLRFMRAELPIILATRSGVLSPRMMRVIEELAGDWSRLDERIDGLSKEIEALARQDPAYERLMRVSGIGQIISSAMVAAIGNGAMFTKGTRLRRWAGTGVQANLDRRPHDSRSDIAARCRSRRSPPRLTKEARRRRPAGLLKWTVGTCDPVRQAALAKKKRPHEAGRIRGAPILAKIARRCRRCCPDGDGAGNGRGLLGGANRDRTGDLYNAIVREYVFSVLPRISHLYPRPSITYIYSGS